MDPAASNYRPAAVLSKRSDCRYPIVGCTNSRFFGFNPNATVMNIDSCGVAVREGCTDSRASSYRADANTHVAAACAFFGCTDSSRPNYDPSATREDGSCERVYTGCMDPAATNYRSIATVPGYCAHPGCMDRASVVFDSRATYDDGSCYAYVLGCTESLAQVSPIFNATPNPHLNLDPNFKTLTLTLTLTLTVIRTSARARLCAPSAPTTADVCAAPVVRTSRLSAFVTTRARRHPPRSPRRRPRADGGSVTRARRVRAPSTPTAWTPPAGAAPPTTRAPSTSRCAGARPG